MANRPTYGIDDFSPAYIPEFDTPEKYVKQKIEMLRKHFYIDLTYEEIAHLHELKTENSINAAVRSIINKYLG